MADDFRRQLDKGGPGGVHCDCCRLGDYGYGHERKRASRLARRRLKAMQKKAINGDS